jgi:hydroxypyruvate reductase
VSETFLPFLFDAAVAAANPLILVPPFLPPRPKGRCVVIGAGKAAARMAQAVEEHMPGPLSGLVVTPYGHGVPCRQVRVLEAAHPIPDAAGETAARRILHAVRGLAKDDLVLCLISGGGSALLSLPAPSLTINDKRALTEALLKSGAAISEINCVRKHLSAIKGGRLAAAAFPAKTLTLIISDVAGDNPEVIASGPTVADPTTIADAKAILEKYAIDLPAAVASFLDTCSGETPKLGDIRLSRAETVVTATPRTALAAAAAAARNAGLEPTILGDALEGESRDLARLQGRLAMQATAGEGRPGLLLSGGETTVTIRGNGRGGPNTEFILALALALDGQPETRAIACDTDGIDGGGDNAGAHISPDTLSRAAKAGLNAAAMLENNDSYGFFSALGDLVITGPTLTNVNDFRAILIGDAG